jgi:hypothetical protein
VREERGQRRLVRAQAGLERRLPLLVRVGRLVDPVPPPVAGREAVEAAELAQRLVVVLDAKVEDAVDRGLLVALSGDDDETRRLPAAVVASRGLGPVERGEEALRERALGRVERLSHRGPDTR